MKILDQLPSNVQDKIYAGFLFTSFLNNFRQFFLICKDSQFAKVSRNFFTWKDQIFREYMMNILTNLEPRYEALGTVVVDELDEFGEVTFIYQGTIAIGYEINKMRKYCNTKTNKCVIGAFGVTFNQRAAYIYTAITNCHGFFIRRANWMRINKLSPEIFKVMKQNVLVDYLMNIRYKVIVHKKLEVARFMDRKDH